MKLVRDKIPDIIREDGRECKYHVADYNEYKAHLYEKMREELDEFINTPCYEEAADIYEVFSSICAMHDMNMVRVEVTALDKADLYGGFKNRIILEEVSES